MPEELTQEDQTAIEKIKQLAEKNDLHIKGGSVRRTSSRFCFGVEHGDYNGTELFGVATDRFIWFAYRPNSTNRINLFSGNFPNDGIIKFEIGNISEPKSASIANTWARFPYGVEYILRREGFKLNTGIDGVVFGNIPGGGMSRSASLTLNLMLSLLEVNGFEEIGKTKIVDMAQAVENDYIGSPCGKLDQVMILFGREGMGTHYYPKTREVKHLKYGGYPDDFSLVVMDTGTVRPGLEKATYAIRRAECERLVEILQSMGYKGIQNLADLRSETLYKEIMEKSIPAEYLDKSVVTDTGRGVPITEEGLKSRLKYIFHAQKRFYEMLDAWKAGDIETVGRIFRADGIGLRDDYKISGPELETMCDIARGVPGVLGERMLGGGDKGASGAIVRPDVVKYLKAAIDLGYPRSHPDFAGKYAVHVCKPVEGVKVFDGLLK